MSSCQDQGASSYTLQVVARNNTHGAVGVWVAHPTRSRGSIPRMEVPPTSACFFGISHKVNGASTSRVSFPASCWRTRFRTSAFVSPSWQSAHSRARSRRLPTHSSMAASVMPNLKVTRLSLISTTKPPLDITLPPSPASAIAFRRLPKYHTNGSSP